MVIVPIAHRIMVTGMAAGITVTVTKAAVSVAATAATLDAHIEINLDKQ